MILVLYNMTCEDIQRICDYIDTAHPHQKGVYYIHDGKTQPVRDAIIIKRHYMTDKIAGHFRVIVSLAVRRIDGDRSNGTKKITPLSHETFHGFFSLSETLFRKEEKGEGCQ